MPNWVEGKLKIRGKPEDIKRWVEECLHCYTTNWLGDGAHTELVKGAVRFERDPDSEEMYLYVDKSAHIEGTRRNFVEKGEYVDLWTLTAGASTNITWGRFCPKCRPGRS